MAAKTSQSKVDSTLGSSSPKFGMGFKTTRNRVDPTTNLTLGQLATLGVIVAAALQFSLTYLVMNDKINLNGKATAKSLTSLGSRIEYVLRYQALHVLWLLMTTLFVILRRLSTGAVNPLEGFENLILTAKQIHTNSMEQYFLLFVNQLILVTNLAPDLFLRVIPLLNVLFIIARILFWLGYPKYRTAGFIAGMTPIAIATLYNTYALINFIF